MRPDKRFAQLRLARRAAIAALLPTLRGVTLLLDVGATVVACQLAAALQAGENNDLRGHRHLDLGSFILESLGERWIIVTSAPCSQAVNTSVGVSAPVRPTLTSIFLMTLVACRAGNL